MKLFGIACLLTLLCVAPAQGDIFWNVKFNDVVDRTGVGFDDATLGATRRNTFNSVFGYLNTVLAHSGQVDIEVQRSRTTAGGFLAAAEPYFNAGSNGFQNGFAFQHATTGVDVVPGAIPDATLQFNFGYNWNSGIGTPGGSQYDLFSVSLHEITHSLGFLSLANSAGVSQITGTGTGTGNFEFGVYSVYDSFLERGDGTKLFGAGGKYLGTSTALTSSDVFFGGQNAIAANGGRPVKVYAPSSFADGSSISHIEGIDNAVLQFSIAPGVERRAYTAQEIGILQDIGWQVTAVPEPGSIALVSLAIAGFAGFKARQRRKASRLGESNLSA